MQHEQGEPPTPDQIDRQFAAIVGPEYPNPPQWTAAQAAMTPPPPRKSRVGMWVAVGAGATALVCLCTAVVTVLALPSFLRDRDTVAAPSAKPSKSAGPAVSPKAGDTLSVRQAWARERIAEALAEQEAALVSGSESGYLEILDATAKADVRDGLKRQYGSLRAMQAVEATDEVDASPTPGSAKDEWRVTVETTVCFAAPGCDSGGGSSSQLWTIASGKARLIEWRPTNGANPWQTDALKAAVGKRAVVATTADKAGKLPFLLQQAEASALVADRFARNGKIPSRYVVYYAPAAQWKKWFDWNPPDWSGGVAIKVSEERRELVLNAANLPDFGVDDLMRHEMTHASSLSGRFRDTRNLWWLVEGIAMLAEREGSPVGSYDGIRAVPDELKNAGNSVTIEGPLDSDADLVVSGKYAVAFLGVRCIAEKFGEANMVEFFHVVVHDGKKLNDASEQVLHLPWSQVDQSCYAYAMDVAK